MAGPIGDLIPIPIPLLTNVSSIGDAFIATGLGWFIFATLVRGASEVLQPAGVTLGPGVQTVAQTGIGLERPVVLGGAAGPGLSSPPSFTGRIRGHPFVKLALDYGLGASGGVSP